MAGANTAQSRAGAHRAVITITNTNDSYSGIAMRRCQHRPARHGACPERRVGMSISTERKCLLPAADPSPPNVKVRFFRCSSLTSTISSHSTGNLDILWEIRVLRFVATALKRCLKGADRPARYEADAFAVLLPDTRFAGATAAAEQVRKYVSSGNLRGRETGTTYGKITLSIGLAQYEPGDSPYQLLERAEHALHEQ